MPTGKVPLVTAALLQCKFSFVERELEHPAWAQDRTQSSAERGAKSSQAFSTMSNEDPGWEISIDNPNDSWRNMLWVPSEGQLEGRHCPPLHILMQSDLSTCF